MGVELEFSLTKDTTCCIVLCEGGHLDDRSAAEARLAGFLCAGRTVPGGISWVQDCEGSVGLALTFQGVYPVSHPPAVGDRRMPDGAQCGAQWPPAQALHHHRAGAPASGQLLASQEEVMGIYHFVRRQRDDKA